jgi:hypothetical protein
MRNEKLENRGLNNDDEPCYVISVTARMVGIHAQSRRNYG